jgi:hypothetical protein
MTAPTDISFRDLVQREKQAAESLRREQARLRDRKHLSNAERAELDRITAVLERLHAKPEREAVDPLWIAVRDFLNKNPNLFGKKLINPRDGVFRVADGESELDSSDVTRLALILGFLADDKVKLPRVKHVRTDVKGDAEIVVDVDDPLSAAFSKHFFPALGDAQGALDLASLVLPILEDLGDRDDGDEESGEVEVLEFAQVMRCLEKSGVTTREMHLKRKVDQCLDKIQRVGTDRPLTETVIALPNFDQITESKIPPENIRQVGVWICVAMFRELKVYQVVEKILTDAQDGTIVLGVNRANEMLYDWWRNAPNRLSDFDRENMLAKILGLPGGTGRPGYERFNSDLTRACATVSSLVRQAQTDRLLRSNYPAAINQQQVRKAWRDFALGLSSNSFGMSHLLAREEQGNINFIIELLSDKDLLACYGAPDMRGLIDQIAMVDLGGLRNSGRYLSMATCGAIITSWLADNIDRINSPTGRLLIDLGEVLQDDPPTAGAEATTHPTVYDFVNACELWLLDNAQSEATIENLANEPVISPDIPSRPIPAIARDLLAQVGVPALGRSMSYR